MTPQKNELFAALPSDRIVAHLDFTKGFGVYAVLSYARAGRTQEIGVRMALLGATRRGIYWLTLRDAAAPVFGGLAAGWAANLMAGELIEKLCTARAHFFRRAERVRVDPMQALRSQ